MSSVPERTFVTVAEYLKGEDRSEVKHEYIAGYVYAMVGAKNSHNIIATNVLGHLFGQLNGEPCRAFNSDTKIRIRMKDQTRFYYPDVSIVCSANPQGDSFQDSPAVIFEVLSDSTRRTDEGEKCDAYLTIPTLTHYVMLEQDSVRAIVYQRGLQGFERRIVSGPDECIRFDEIDAELRLGDAYDGVELA
ncbi:MAG: Uma2 family endonuclease [Planctomycetaceae bacterium]